MIYNIFVFVLVCMALLYASAYFRSRKQTTQLRQWLMGIRDIATDEKVSRDTVRQAAVDALDGKVRGLFETE